VQRVTWLDKCTVSAIMTPWDQFTLLIFTLLKVMASFLGEIPPTVRRYLPYRRE